MSDPPLGPRRLDFGTLSDDDFEGLCFLVVQIDYPETIRLRAPDGGADSALPGAPARLYARCWQSKRFTGHVSWPKCVDSLDRAVETYAMPHYTFCFARDLTGHQELEFRKRLVGRHADVEVDYWGASRLLSWLVTTDAGERITKHFYGDPAVDTQALMLALRSGGALEDGRDAAERLSAIAEFLAKQDPYFSYPVSARETNATPPPLPHPGSIMAVERVGPTTTERFEAVPRNADALMRLPEGTLFFDNTPGGRSQLAAFQRTLAEGGETTLEGVGLQMRQLPKLFETFDPPPDKATITIRAQRPAPTPWHARVNVKSDQGEASLVLRLDPAEPPDDWHAALSGTYGGLTITLLLRKAGDKGEVMTTWTYRGLTNQLREQVQALAVLEALHRSGTFELEDLDGVRPMLTQQTEARTIDPFIPHIRRLVENLIVIEDWTGVTLELPTDAPPSELQGIAEAAHIIRTGESRMTFDVVELVIDKSKADALIPPGGIFRIEMEFALETLGRTLPLGYLAGNLSDIRVEVTPAKERGSESVNVRIVPASEQARKPVFVLSKTRSTPSPAAPR